MQRTTETNNKNDDRKRVEINEWLKKGVKKLLTLYFSAKTFANSAFKKDLSSNMC